MAEEIDFENRHFLNFKSHVTLTLTWDDTESHIVVNGSSTLTNITIWFVVALSLIMDILPVFGRLYYRSSLWYTVLSVCLSSVFLSVCLSSVTFCMVAKRYVLAKNCLKEWIRNQGQKVHFLSLRHISTFRFCRYGHRDGRFCLIFACTAQQSILDGKNWLSSSKPCAYCRIVWSELKPDEF